MSGAVRGIFFADITCHVRDCPYHFDIQFAVPQSVSGKLSYAVWLVVLVGLLISFRPVIGGGRNP